MNTDHTAIGPALGYYYQSMFALVTVLGGNDDAAVSVETCDDVYFESGARRSLLQLKHSIQGDPPKVSVKADLLWKSIAVWCDAHQDDPGTNFVLVTVGGIVDGDAVCDLVESGPRERVLHELEVEAERIVNAVRAHEESKSKGSPPYEKKIHGARAFLGIPAEARKRLVERIYVQPNCPNVADIEEHVCSLLPLIPPKYRLHAARHLIAWFDLRVVRALTGKDAVAIRKSEVTEWIWSYVRDRREEALPDIFRTAQPPPDFLLPENASKQLTRIDAPDQARQRAATSYWRAISQRNAWMEEDIMRAAELDDYDDHLVQEFSDQRSERLSTLAIRNEEALKSLGRDLLHWSHFDAPDKVDPIRPAWKSSYLVRGTFQALADAPSIYWHPDDGMEEDDETN